MLWIWPKVHLDAQNIKQFWYWSSASKLLLIAHTHLTTHGYTNYSFTHIWFMRGYTGGNRGNFPLQILNFLGKNFNSERKYFWTWTQKILGLQTYYCVINPNQVALISRHIKWKLGDKFTLFAIKIKGCAAAAVFGTRLRRWSWQLKP